MKRINKQAIIWGMLMVFVLAAAVAPQEFPVRAEAKTKSSQKTEDANVEAGIVKQIRTEMIAGYSALADAGNIDTEFISEEMPVSDASIQIIDVPVVAAEEQVDSFWDTHVMAKVAESANIRTAPDQNSELAGRLRNGDAAEIVEQAAEWTKLSSGNVTGYVRNDFLAFGAEAEAVANQTGKKATVTTESLRIRKAPGEDAGVITLAAAGSVYEVMSEENGWVGIKLSSGQPGYVKAEYVTVELNLGSAISIEEERAAIKAEKEKKAAEEAKKAKLKLQTNSKKVSTTERDAVNVSVSEETLLGALVQLEAGGESYQGKLAVACVVINRVKASGFPGSVEGVIYQRGQFPGARNGSLARILAKGVKSSCIEAAQEALSGTNNIGNYLHFISRGSAGSKSDYTVIGNHCFY